MRYEQFSIRETLADPFGGTLALNAGLTVYLSDNTPEIDAARRHPMAVSYTHLDVYKRQQLARAHD